MEGYGEHDHVPESEECTYLKFLGVFGTFVWLKQIFIYLLGKWNSPSSQKKKIYIRSFRIKYHIYAGTTFGLLGMRFWYRVFNILCALYFLIGLQRWISFQKILSSHWTNCVSQCALEDLSYEPRFGKDSTWSRRDDFCEQNSGSAELVICMQRECPAPSN